MACHPVTDGRIQFHRLMTTKLNTATATTAIAANFKNLNLI